MLKNGLADLQKGIAESLASGTQEALGKSHVVQTQKLQELTYEILLEDQENTTRVTIDRTSSLI